MCTVKDRHGKDLREAEEIKNTWEEDTEELYKKGLNDMDNHDGLASAKKPHQRNTIWARAVLSHL